MEFVKFVPYVTCGLPSAVWFLYTKWQCVLKTKTYEFQELSCLEKTMLPVQASGTELVVQAVRCLCSKVEQVESY